MSTAPVTRKPGLTQTDWDHVHTQVQTAFDALAQRVRSSCPAVVVRDGGKSVGRVWFLFSFREFNLSADDSKAEDIIAGVHFSPEGDGIRIRADVGGAETGQIDYEAPERVVPANLGAVMAAVRDLTDRLIGQEEVVVTAMSERRPPPNYRQRSR